MPLGEEIKEEIERKKETATMCWFFHKWGKWSESKTATDWNGDPVVVQFRVCDRCNLKKFKRVASVMGQ